MCGGIGVDVDTVWHEDETVLASRLVRFATDTKTKIIESMSLAFFQVLNRFAYKY